MKIIESFSGRYAFLSNTYNVWQKHNVPVRWGDQYGVLNYPGTEWAFQAAKTLRPATREEISLTTWWEAKRIGRGVRLRPGWDRFKVQIMLEVNRVKFFDVADLGEMLLATENAVLVEGNTWGDDFWGMIDDPSAYPNKLSGANALGAVLMVVRAELRAVS